MNKENRHQCSEPIEEEANYSSDTNDKGVSSERGKKRKCQSEPAWLKKFAEDIQKRHEEKLDRQDRFLNIFERLLEKKS